MDEKVLEALLNATKGIAEINHYQERNVKELDNLRQKMEEQGMRIATLEASLKGLGDSLDSEKKLNRDRQLDASKLLDDKIDTLYKGVSILTATISIVISAIHGFLTK